MPDLEKFNPRAAALNHAGQAKVERSDYGFDVADPTNAIACGLVYIGDQLRRIANVLEVRAERRERNE